MRPGREDDFVGAIAEARAITAAMQGFRGSERYQDWRRLLHHFYEPMPTFEHFERVLEAPGQARGDTPADA